MWPPCRVANLKSIVDDPAAEEGNLVQLSDGSFYVVFRTANGFMGRAVSSDGIRFEDRLFVECERHAPPSAPAFVVLFCSRDF